MNRSATLRAAVVLALPAIASGDELPAQPVAAAVSLNQLQKQGDRLLLNGTPFTGTVIDILPDGTRKAQFQVLRSNYRTRS